MPSTQAEVEALVASVESSVADFEGHVVTEEEAQAHLNKTNTIALLDGTTVYVNDKDGDEEGARYIKATFTKTEIEVKEYDKDAELIHSGTESYILKDDGSIDAGKEDNFKIDKIDGDTWYIICTCDDDDDGVKETTEHHIWYTKKPSDWPSSI